MAKKSNAKNSGRPSVMTEKVVAELKYCFAKGLSDREACDYVGVSRDALYDYCKNNPDFSYQKESLKGQLVVHSKLNLAESIEGGNVADSKWLLERKLKDEYSTRTENTGKNGQPIETKTIYIEKEEKEEYESHIEEQINED